MPEGPQVARHARLQCAILCGERIAMDSPSGRSDDVAAMFDGHTLVGIEAVGKHLIYDFGEELYLHVHLGRFGNFKDGPTPLPEPRGTLRLRMFTDEHWYELRGAIAVEPFDTEQRRLLEARIGPNPLDADAKPAKVFAKIAKSRSPVGLLLMDQSVIAGVGNIYRSEVLFLNHVHPLLPGNELSAKAWRGIWKDCVRVMADGAVAGRIVTTYAKDRHKPSGTVRANDRFYVYHRTGLPCRRCGTAIETGVLGNRTIYWCPKDQAM